MADDIIRQCAHAIREAKEARKEPALWLLSVEGYARYRSAVQAAGPVDTIHGLPFEVVGEQAEPLRLVTADDPMLEEAKAEVLVQVRARDAYAAKRLTLEEARQPELLDLVVDDCRRKLRLHLMRAGG